MDQVKTGQVPDTELDKARICLETARMPWRELQRFFAAGKVYLVSAELDLTEVALRLSQDDVSYVQNHIASGKLAQVPDEIALRWHKADIMLWTVVVKPFVLVQAK